MPMPNKMIVNINGTKVTFLNTAPKSDGLSEGAVYVREDDPHGDLYFFKVPKDRSLDVIFPMEKIQKTDGKECSEVVQRVVQDPALEGELSRLKEAEAKGLKDEKAIAEIKESLAKTVYGIHREDLILMHTFNAVLASKLIPKLLLYAVAETRFFIFKTEEVKSEEKVEYKKDKSCIAPNTPVIISRQVPGYEEHLSKAAVFKKVSKAKDYKEKGITPPTFRELIAECKLTSKDLQDLGRGMYLGLLIQHQDMLNNINLTNSGRVTGEKNIRAVLTAILQSRCTPLSDIPLLVEKLLPQIGESIFSTVDLEPVFGGGYSSSLSDLNAFKNPDFLKQEGEEDNLTGFKYCVPFEKVVSPVFPRQLVNVLMMTGDKEMDTELLVGFKQAHDELLKVKTIIPKLVVEAINDVFNDMDLVDVPRVKKCLHSIFYSTHAEIQASNEWGLGNILQGRVDSLGKIILQFEKGMTSIAVTEDVMTKMRATQRFFVTVSSAPVSSMHSSVSISSNSYCFH